jgi:hypothetical protein
VVLLVLRLILIHKLVVTVATQKIKKPKPKVTILGFIFWIFGFSILVNYLITESTKRFNSKTQTQFDNLLVFFFKLKTPQTNVFFHAILSNHLFPKSNTKIDFKKTRDRDSFRPW